MISKTKKSFIFLIGLVILFTLSPIITNNLYLYARISKNQDQEAYSDLTTSSIPALLVWSYNTYPEGAGNRDIAISSNGKYIAAANNVYLYFFEKDNSTPL